MRITHYSIGDVVARWASLVDQLFFPSNKSVTFSSLLQPTESVILMDSIYESCVHPVNPYSKQICGNRTNILTNHNCTSSDFC